MTNTLVDATIERCRTNLKDLDASRRLLAHSRRLLHRAWWMAGASDDDLRLTIRARLATGALFSAPDKIWSGPGTGRTCVVCGTAISSGEMENENDPRARHDLGSLAVLHDLATGIGRARRLGPRGVGRLPCQSSHGRACSNPERDLAGSSRQQIAGGPGSRCGVRGLRQSHLRGRAVPGACRRSASRSRPFTLLPSVVRGIPGRPPDERRPHLTGHVWIAQNDVVAADGKALERFTTARGDMNVMPGPTKQVLEQLGEEAGRPDAPWQLS